MSDSTTAATSPTTSVSSRVVLLTRLGWIWAGVAVALGAFGAHGLASRLPEWYPDEALAMRRADNWETAVSYQLVHALGALAIGLWLLGQRRTSRRTEWGGWSLLVGNAVFSGCLYALVLTDVRILGAIVPLGGVVQLLGWFLIAATPFGSSAPCDSSK
ncbi:MAG: DUF423 domain-containing protein [Pirellulaceae bacterium]